MQSTIELGHNMGLRVTTEGVENQDSHDILKKLGCDDLQGYFISKPLPIDQFDEWFKTYNENANIVKPNFKVLKN